MRNQFESYYRTLQKRNGLRLGFVLAVLLHAGVVAGGAFLFMNGSGRDASEEVMAIQIVPGEVKDPTKPTSVAAPKGEDGTKVKKPEPKPEEKKPEPPKEEPKPEPKKQEVAKKEEPKPEPKKEEPKKEEPKKEEPKKEEKKPEPKKEEVAKKEEKKPEPKKEEPKKTEPPKKETPKKTTPPPKLEEAKDDMAALAEEIEWADDGKLQGKPEGTDPEMDKLLGDVQEFAKTTNPNGIDSDIIVFQPGDLGKLGLWPSRVHALVTRAWQIPAGVSQFATETVIGFTVDRSGQIVGSVEIITESDDPEITRSALEALEFAKFPPLPDSFEKPTAYIEYHFKVNPGQSAG